MPRKRSHKAVAVAAVLAAVVVLALGGVASAQCPAFALTANPSTTSPDSTVALRATGLHDAYCNPIAGATVTFQVTRPGDATPSPAGEGITGEDGGAEVYWNDTSLYNGYVARATSGAAQASAGFSVAPGRASGTFSVEADPAPHVAGNPVTLSASAIKDAENKPVVNGTIVTFVVTHPDGTTSTYSGTTSGVTSSSNTAGTSATIPGTDNTRAGTYAVAAQADDASSSTTYAVWPGPPVADLTVAADNARVWESATVTISGIPSGAITVELTMTKPDASTYSASTTTIENGASTITVPGRELNQIGTYNLAAAAKDQDGVTIGVGSGSFEVSAGPHEYTDCSSSDDIQGTSELDQGELIPAQEDDPDPDAWHPTVCVAVRDDVVMQPVLFWGGHPVNPASPQKPCGELWVFGENKYDSDGVRGNTTVC
ncbi:MAG: hypothetical protein HY775_13580 [Acidobacteria bacterium]|nr:hypothetical protein [Acidobacteriota bacterium]